MQRVYELANDNSNGRKVLYTYFIWRNSIDVSDRKRNSRGILVITNKIIMKGNRLVFAFVQYMTYTSK